MALALKPRLLLLDEPTAGMGDQETFDITELIRRLHRDHGLSILLVEHDMRVVFHLADRIMVMAEGTVGPDVGVLRPGSTVNVRGVGLFFNGSYYVTRVNHTIETDSYVQKFEAQRNAVKMTGAELFVQP